MLPQSTVNDQSGGALCTMASAEKSPAEALLYCIACCWQRSQASCLFACFGSNNLSHAGLTNQMAHTLFYEALRYRKKTSCPSRATSCRAAPSKATGQNQAGQSAAGQNQAGQSAAGQNQAGPSAAGQNQAEPSAAGQNSAEPSAAGQIQPRWKGKVNKGGSHEGSSLLAAYFEFENLLSGPSHTSKADNDPAGVVCSGQHKRLSLGHSQLVLS